MNCSSCGHENPAAAKFCLECGTRFRLTCAKCGAELPGTAKFCLECGHSVAAAAAMPSPQAYTPKHLAEKILDSAASLEGERKTITALFADIKGSMELLEDLDPEEARRVIDPALKLMMDAVHRYEGYVAQSMGDGIFALFGAPIAHEDHPQRALYAALRMQEEAERYGDELQRDKGIRLPIRVGINTGEVVVRSIRKNDLHTDYVPVGHSTSLAARMENLAKPGTTLVSEHTHKLTEGYFRFKALGPAKVKGVSEPVEVFEVASVGPLRTRLQLAVRRGLVRFVGRQRELEQMRQAWKSAQVSQGQMVAVMGEAGVGKSRLVYEFKVPLESESLVLEAFSVSHGKAHAYLPLIDLLKSYFRIGLEDDERRRREKITGKVLTLDRALEDTLPYLFELLGIAEPTSPLAQMNPQIRRQRTLDAIKRLLVRESLNQPLLLIFEDLHWIDGETQAFLDLLADSLATAKILLLVNYRPEYQHGWGSKTYYTRLRLDPLGEEEAEELLTALLGEAELKPLRQLILEKTEGNPFFMEEVVQTLAEQGILSGERGQCRLEKPASELQIPTTVQGVLAARIDRLPADEKEFLQTLAVIGKEFPFGLVHKVTGHSEDELQRMLSHLQAAEFIYEQPAFPEPEYTFKHALTQEVAYQSLLLERRKLLHERTAAAIEDLYQYALDEHYSELAHHYSRSDNNRKAVKYLYLAGRQAQERAAFGDAISLLTAGLELLETLPEVVERDQQELLLQLALGRALMSSKGYAAQEVESAYVRAQELCRQVGEEPQLFHVLGGLFSFYLVRAELNKAQEQADQIIRLAQSRQDSQDLASAHQMLGTTLYYRGELTQALEHLQRAIALYDPQLHRPDRPEAGVSQLSFAAGVLWHLGYPDQGLKRTEEALTLARELSHPVSLACALAFAAGLHQYFRRDLQAARENAEAVVALSKEHGFPDWLAMGIFVQGRVLVGQGQPEDGIKLMRPILDAMRSVGTQLGIPAFLAMLAGTHGKVRQPEQGLTLISEALDLANKTGQHLYASHLCRVKGELLLATSADNQAEAEACFCQAIDVAKRRSAKSSELRAVISLARLWHTQCKKDEARQLLAEIYGWFSEGFDTLDLKEAKALLAELS